MKEGLHYSETRDKENSWKPVAIFQKRTNKDFKRTQTEAKVVVMTRKKIIPDILEFTTKWGSIMEHEESELMWLFCSDQRNSLE